MLKRVVVVFLAVMFSASALSAQTAAKESPASKPKAPADTPKADRPGAKAAPEPVALPINIKIEVSITDQTGTNQPAKKLVTMIARDQGNNSIRSSASVPVKGPNSMVMNYRNVTINVDASPRVVTKEPTKIFLSLGLEYLPKSAGGAEELEPGMSQLNERLSLVLESGKPMIVSQAADPTSDRKITVEVTATILK
jgi:hypothetical protein